MILVPGVNFMGGEANIQYLKKNHHHITRSREPLSYVLPGSED